MQDNFFVDAKDVLQATRGGLDIIIELYPAAQASADRPSKKFKLHEEKTASASLKKTPEGNWLVTDFGDDQQPRNGIQCFMKERGLKYVDALRELAVKYNVVSVEQQAQVIKAQFSEKPAEPDQLESTWSFNIREKSRFTDIEIELLISKNVLKALNWKHHDQVTADRARARIQEKFNYYRWHPIVSYTYIKDRRAMTFTATDDYPMFLIDEGTHQKIYQPKHPDKGKRFMYSGEKPKDFIHGLAQLRKAFEDNRDAIVEDEEYDKENEDRDNGAATGGEDKDARLDEVIQCSGGSDAINVALLGYQVIWLNSETAELQFWQYHEINKMVKKFYQLQDIDATGKASAHKLNMQYIDIHNIELPDALRIYRDNRGNPCKDVRDYFNHFKEFDFKTLLKLSVPYRFWNKTARYEGRGEKRFFAGYDFEFDAVQAFNFLQKNGFGRFRVGEEKREWIFIQQVGSRVKEVEAGDIEDFLHDFLEERQFDKELRNAMYYTGRLNAQMLAKLKQRLIDFEDATKDSQFLFFENYTLEITKDDVKYHKPASIDRYVWDNEVLQHRIQRPKEAPFKITKNEMGDYDIEIIDKNCPFLKYLVQTSRVHWRQELEYRLVDKPEAEAEKYLADNKCVIDGPLLTIEEVAEQKLHLVNKIFVIGYMLHRYKAPNKPWLVWAQDNKISDDGRSHGGSGKSILFDYALRALLKRNLTINGRILNPENDKFKYDGVDEHTRYILIDDAHEFLKLEPLYKDISGDLNVNPKGKTAFSIPYDKSAKIAVTSNYAPKDLGPSTERRYLPSAFSDYYHNKGEYDDYKEKRDPQSDLGLQIPKDFNFEQWNSFYQVMIHAVQFYLGTDEQIRPAMGNVNKRTLLAEMGNFHDFALVYLSPESGRLDTMIVREEFQKDYVRYNENKISPQKFTARLVAFCRYYGYTLNPKEYTNDKGLIIKRAPVRIWIESSSQWINDPGGATKTSEMLYIQSNGNAAPPADSNQVEPEPDITPGTKTPLGF